GEKEIALLRLILSWNGVLGECEKNYHVHPICDYALDLAGAFNSFYAAVPVLSEGNLQARGARLLILEAFMERMGQAMWVLGIGALERM
ncbi:MAG: DALR anticodon-binding domain-containing protein, partial [Candidatus Micrarchaeota archaeon]